MFFHTASVEQTMGKLLKQVPDKRALTLEETQKIIHDMTVVGSKMEELYNHLRQHDEYLKSAGRPNIFPHGTTMELHLSLSTLKQALREVTQYLQTPPEERSDDRDLVMWVKR